MVVTDSERYTRYSIILYAFADREILAKDSDCPTGNLYACKVLKQSHYAEASAEREAIIAINNQRHPNIVHVIDAWTENDRDSPTCYIQMELCEGDLSEFLQSRYIKNPLSLPEIWDIFQQIIGGLIYIHSREMVHRDLKPKNSMTIPA